MIIDFDFNRAFEEVVPFDSAYAYRITYPVRETSDDVLYMIHTYPTMLSDQNTSWQHLSSTQRVLALAWSYIIHTFHFSFHFHFYFHIAHTRWCWCDSNSAAPHPSLPQRRLVRHHFYDCCNLHRKVTPWTFKLHQQQLLYEGN